MFRVHNTDQVILRLKQVSTFYFWNLLANTNYERLEFDIQSRHRLDGFTLFFSRQLQCSSTLAFNPNYYISLKPHNVGLLQVPLAPRLYATA